MLPWIAGAWLIGLFIGARWQPVTGPLLVASALVCALVLALHGRELGARLWAALLALFALMCGLGVRQPTAVPCTVAGDVKGTALVESVRFGVADARLRLRVREAHLAESGHRLAAGLGLEGRIEIENAPPAGSIVRLDGNLRPRTVLSNPSPHPELMPPRQGGCWIRWRETERLTVIETPPVLGTIAALRARVRRHLIAALSPEGAAVGRALVLGDGAALGYERRRTIAAAGLAHLFAVSGLHIALISGTLVTALRWLVRGCAIGFDARRVAAGMGVPLTLLHATFAGGSPSAWRAAMTATATWALVALGRRPAPASITAAAALVLSAPEPAMALRPAFLLSIVATSAILGAPHLGHMQRGRRLARAASVSARTLIATTPMVWWWFGGVPLVGWLTNILVLPFGSWVVIPLAHLFSMTAWVPALIMPLRGALESSVALLLSVCEGFAALAVTRRLPPLDPTQGLVVAVACALLLVVRSWRARFVVVGAAGLLWVGAEQALVLREQPRGVVRVSFVDVGQGDASLIDLPDGALALIDTGQGGRHPAGRALLSLLAARRRTRIDLLVITHGHPDHYGGLDALIDEVDIGEIWLNGQLLIEEREGAIEALLNQALASGSKLQFPPDLCGKTREFGSAQLEVLWPCPRYDPGLDLNDNSLTVRLSLGRRSFLFTGDLEREAERRLVAAGRVEPIDVLKVAHHGSRTSTIPVFLAAARPSIAVISSGAGNRYGHPSLSVLARLREAGVRVFRTDRGGGVVVTTDGDRLATER